ncbi:hypothetical protein EBZ35_08445 [bacterium]|nr:hypothetical protein [bacterium]
MSFDKFIQTRTIAQKVTLSGFSFPTYSLDSFIEFETDGYLVGIHFMVTHNAIPGGEAGAIDPTKPAGAIVAKVSGDILNLPAGGNFTNYSGAQILVSHLALPDSDANSNLESNSRQTTIAYDADSKRIPMKSNDRLGVYLCTNSDTSAINFAYTLTAYFVRA